jgi:citrate/tricarballylate utilization protein
MLDLPRTFSEIRVETYKKYAWPGFMAALFQRSGLAFVLSTVASAAIFVLAMFWRVQPSVLFSAHPSAQGGFYSVLPHDVMVLVFGAVSMFTFVALLMGVFAFWREMGEGIGALFNVRASLDALGDALRLRYLDSAGDGCTYPGDLPSGARRWFHHLTSYGFLCCFAATTTGAVYHYVFRWEAPYSLLSAPVLLGSIGGVGLLFGPIGLLWLKARRSPELMGREHTSMDIGFLVLLLLTSLTGFLLLGFREKSAMGILLGVHLGVVTGLFLTLPYGKFVHATYRLAALLRNSLERQRDVN